MTPKEQPSTGGAGTEVIYASASRSLAALEILVHYSVLPKGFLITSVYIPHTVSIMDVPDAVLIEGWDQPVPIHATQEYGRIWIAARSSAVLRVPSAVVPNEWNYVLNVLHPEFRGITFGLSEPFHFDPRLK
jgi:RES domain-containing protein